MKQLLLLPLLCCLALTVYGQSAGDLIITEFMADPDAVADNIGEYFELYNDTNAPININGFELSDDDIDSHTIANGGPLVIDPGSYLVLARTSDFLGNGTAVADYVYSGYFLANGADEIVISKGATEIARAEYTDGDAFGDGVAFELVNTIAGEDGVTTQADYIASTTDMNNDDGSGDGQGDFGSPGFAGGTLPVELTAFDAVADGAGVLLTWNTASETNNAGFEVEHRRDGAFTRIGFVEGAGTTAQARAYRYEVEGLLPGRHVFRLRQVDFDGAFEYSPVVEVAVAVPGMYQLSDVYPNPFNPRAQFTLALEQAQYVEIGLHDALGREVARLHSGELPAGEGHRFTVEGSGLPSGAYLLRAVGRDFATTRRVTLLK